MSVKQYYRAVIRQMIWLAPALAVAIAAINPAAAERPAALEAGALLIDAPWTRATPGGAKVGAGYLTIINRGETGDRLVDVSSDIADRTEIHTMTMADGVMRMRHLQDGLVIAPRSVTELKPGGYHIMFVGLKKAIGKGDTVAVRLTFENAGAVDVALEAGAIGAMTPPGQADGGAAAAGSRSGSNAGSGSQSGAAGSRSGPNR